MLLGLLLAMGMFTASVARADGISMQRASLEADSGGGWNLDARFDFSLNGNLIDAVSKGIPLYFTTEFELVKPRWYWFDQNTISASQSIRLSFQPLTRQYRVTSGGLQLGFDKLDDALAVIKHVTSWHVIDRDAVRPGNVYIASVRMQLDTALMPKFFQIDAVNNRDWRLTSDWRQFTFTPPDNGR